MAFGPTAARIEGDDVGGKIERARLPEERASNSVRIDRNRFTLELRDFAGVEAAAGPLFRREAAKQYTSGIAARPVGLTVGCDWMKSPSGG